MSRNGVPHPRCVNDDGAALAAARRRKELRYLELTGDHGRARLVVLASEVGGRWSEESRDFLRQLAKAKTRSAPRAIRGHNIGFVAEPVRLPSLLLERRGGLGVDGPTPASHDVEWEARYLRLAFRLDFDSVFSVFFKKKKGRGASKGTCSNEAPPSTFDLRPPPPGHVGSQKGGAPKGWWGPKFRAFFSLSVHIFILFVPLWVFSSNFGGV